MPNALYDPDRIDPMIELLRKQWKAHPTLRLCQLIVNLSDSAEPFYVDDVTMKNRLTEFEI
jgi:uncharacterized protein YihD (DUF1040 family)